MTTKEYSAYIKGLLDGTNLDTNTPEGKIISALVDLCGKMAGEIDTLTDELDIANQYIEEIDEDLGAVEEIVYEDPGCDCDDDDCDCCGDCDDCDDCDDDCDCGCCCGDDDDCDEDEEEFYCAMCPGCGNKISFAATVATAAIV